MTKHTSAKVSGSFSQGCADKADHAACQVRPRPPLFRALGAQEPPPEVEIGGCRYHLVEVLKHDSWAATAIYDGPGGKKICKFNRVQSIGPIPMKWLGRRLARREIDFLIRLSSHNVPHWAGSVHVNGQTLENAAARDYLPGHPLGKTEAVSQRFLDELKALLHEVHRQDMAYVDLHKKENIIVGDDGQPYLIDFQISFALPKNLLGRKLLRPLLSLLQKSDDYHLAKIIVSCWPGTQEHREEYLADQRPWWIKLHRLIGVPIRTARRGLLVLLGIRAGAGMATTEVFPEDAVRAEMGAGSRV